MAKYIFFTAMLLCLFSCRTRKVLTIKEETVEKVVTTTRDTTVELPGRNLDTTLPVSVLLPESPGMEKKTVLKKDGITASITAKDSSIRIAIDTESLKLQLQGYIKEEVIKHSTKFTKTDKKEPNLVSVFTALGLALFIGTIFWLIYKFR